MLIDYSDVVAQVYFEDASADAGIDHYSVQNIELDGMNGGVAWFDFNNDGWEDLYVTGGLQFDKLYINNQDGTFDDNSISSGIHQLTSNRNTYGVSAADLNRDGFEDLVVTTDSSSHNLVLMNMAAQTFQDVALSSGVGDTAISAGVSFGDLNDDGWVDMYITNWRASTSQPPPGVNYAYTDRLYLNNQDGTFSDITLTSSVYSVTGAGLAAAFSDYDLDGDVDLLVANDFGGFPQFDNNKAYRNDGGVLVDVSSETGFNIGIHAMGVAVGDYDEDLDLDYYVTDIGGNALLRNDGGSFVDVASNANVLSEWHLAGGTNTGQASWSWGTVFFDYDNDSYLDLFSSNGFITQLVGLTDENRLFRNINASGTFEDVSVLAGMNTGLMNRGCAAADYDHDGDLDMAIATIDTLNGLGRCLLMENLEGSMNNWVELSLTGTASNVDAIGTLVRLYAGQRSFIREVDGGGGSYLSHNSKLVHFGLGSIELIDSVVIEWPSGVLESFDNVSLNERITIIEGNGVVVSSEVDSELHLSLYPNPTDAYLFLSMDKPVKSGGYAIYDRMGVLVSKSDNPASKSTLKIDVSGLSKGFYLIELKGNGFVSGRETFVVN
jgi:hypothetical protein